MLIAAVLFSTAACTDHQESRSVDTLGDSGTALKTGSLTLVFEDEGGRPVAGLYVSGPDFSEPQHDILCAYQTDAEGRIPLTSVRYPLGNNWVKASNQPPMEKEVEGKTHTKIYHFDITEDTIESSIHFTWPY